MMKFLVPHKEYEIRVCAPMDDRNCYYSVLCGNRCNFELFVTDDRGVVVLDKHVCQHHLVTEAVNVLLGGVSCLTPVKP